MVLTRSAARAAGRPELAGAELLEGDPVSPGAWEAALEGCDAVVNFAGHNIFEGRWNEARKRRIRDSRILTTERIAAAIARSPSPPRVLVQASAVGYYGPRGDEVLNEDDPPGSDFLADVTREWEAAARSVLDRGVRLVTLRIGIVLDRHDGALAIMIPLFRYGPGVPVGGGGHPLWPARGRQWMSWIHRADVVRLALLALDDLAATGPINTVAPEPVRNVDFARSLSRVLWKPYAFWRITLPIGPPDVFLRLLLGEVSSVISTGQRVRPARALELGFAFQFPTLPAALADLFPA